MNLSMCSFKCQHLLLAQALPVSILFSQSQQRDCFHSEMYSLTALLIESKGDSTVMEDELVRMSSEARKAAFALFESPVK